MEQAIFNSAIKEGLFAVLFVVAGFLLWRQMARIQDDGRAREERMLAAAKDREDQMYSDALRREERLMRLAEDLTARFEKLASQYDGLALDVTEIKSVMKGER
ncbi:BhlA/UviB family holin-like peptide [Paenibacillus xylanexedens]|uniref:BhlA/UviB family holin-like peptide n=1 Tax=Paenibacillus xylanexedens TaxID=528191 RepID=UPI0011A68850|nr:BhlA/UviB family holin-like peptide [Paenibacillus xylanexedens]